MESKAIFGAQICAEKMQSSGSKICTECHPNDIALLRKFLWSRLSSVKIIYQIAIPKPKVLRSNPSFWSLSLTSLNKQFLPQACNAWHVSTGKGYSPELRTQMKGDSSIRVGIFFWLKARMVFLQSYRQGANVVTVAKSLTHSCQFFSRTDFHFLTGQILPKWAVQQQLG